MKYAVCFSLLFMNCTYMKNQETIAFPEAEKIPKALKSHGHERVDNYYWMRLSDEQKSTKDPDEQTKKVMDYLQAENDYLDATLGHTKAFQEKLFEEIKGRIKQQDESVPYFKNGYWYYTRFETGQEYPIYCRKEKSMDSEEIILMDVNEMAEGHDYYQIGGMSVSPDNNWLAYGEDTLSRRIYTIRFKNLVSGETLEESIPNSEGSVAWANDNKTVFYTAKNEVTLLSEKIQRHVLGTHLRKT